MASSDAVLTKEESKPEPEPEPSSTECATLGDTAWPGRNGLPTRRRGGDNGSGDMVPTLAPDPTRANPALAMRLWTVDALGTDVVAAGGMGVGVPVVATPAPASAAGVAGSTRTTRRVGDCGTTAAGAGAAAAFLAGEPTCTCRWCWRLGDVAADRVGTWSFAAG